MCFLGTAFILYRQHHQAQVVAQHPGLANPDISKIIGEQWREEPEEHKIQWKRLAEEEKQRHQRQYPEYRYQPRRGGKSTTARLTSVSGEDPGRCPKCGGRYIATPRTPSTPFLTPGGAGKLPMSSLISPNPRVIETDHLRNMPRDRDRDRGRESMVGQEDLVRHSRIRSQWTSPLQNADDEYELMSPSDGKRRRYNMTGYYQGMPVPIQYGSVPGRQMRLPSVPGPASQAVSARMATVRTGSLSGTMAPPPPPLPSATAIRPSAAYPTPRNSGFDESLRLPPLQTQIPNAVAPSEVGGVVVGEAQVQTQVQFHGGLRDSQARSIEAMVMSIPYVNKLKVLSKISPPLAPPGPTSPAVETRGAVIAIEGTDPQLLKQVALVLQNALETTGDLAIRSWSSDENEREVGQSGPSDSLHPANFASAGLTNTSGSPFQIFLRTIMDWHAKSSEITRFITTLACHSSTGVSGHGSDTSSSSMTATGSEDTIMSDNSSTAVASSQPPRQPHGHSPARRQQPVALLTGGFSLSISDKFASTVPITDSYAPVDHWQWMATLWRGIIGPDLVVYVRDSDDMSGIGGSSESGSHSAEARPSQGVEIKAPGIMVVHASSTTGMLEKTERRLSFEVVEWVRAGSYKDGFSRG
jgi:HMG box factor